MKEWLSGLVGESAANIVGFILIFAIILGGIFVVLSIIRRFSGGGFASNGRTGRQPRLSVMDAAAVDSRRKLVLIRRDDVEHLLLIGGPTDVVVEQNIVMESRANSRQATRIEPEHIERFRQHEASITSEVAERPTLSQQVSQAGEKNEAIQLNSPIETPLQRKPEPVREAIVQPAHVEAQQFRTPPAPPVMPVAPQAPRTVEAPVVQSRPQPPRPAPNYPPQPRTVLPAAPRPAEQPQSPRLHPAYPLSQVSRGVLSSTSGLGAGAIAATATVATSDLGSVTPERETTSIKAPVPEISDVVQSPAVVAHVEPKAEPAMVSANAEPEFADDDLGDIGGALHDAIMADLVTESPAISANNEPAMLDVDLFEEELLGSLDISPNDNKPDVRQDDSIEDEMEKLLGELTRNETRNF